MNGCQKLNFLHSLSVVAVVAVVAVVSDTGETFSENSFASAEEYQDPVRSEP